MLRVVIFSSAPASRLARLIGKLAAVPGLCVAGVLLERRPPPSYRARLRRIVRRCRDRHYWLYAAGRLAGAAARAALGFGDMLLRFVHAAPRPAVTAPIGDRELATICRAAAAELRVVADTHAPEALGFTRELQADLGIVYSARILKPELFTIPRLGSINLHKRKVPDYRGGGPVGLWELLDSQAEIGITVHRVQARVDTGAILREARIPIGRFDTLESLSLKADLVGDDLLLATVDDFARGTVQERPQPAGGRTYKAPQAHEMRRYRRELVRRRKRYRATLGRKPWKLLLRSAVLLPWVVGRNWRRRWRGSFPVVVFFHHLVSDEPHYLAMPTSQMLKQLRFLQRHYRLVTVAEAAAMLASGRITAPTVVLTFDDGYGENFLTLRALREATGAPLTLFVCTRHVQEGAPFGHDLAHRNGDRFPPFRPEQLVAMQRAGFEIGSHTRTHFDCGKEDPPALESEILGSRDDLERLLSARARFFSFPWGAPCNISPAALKIAQNSYEAVLSAYGGENPPTGRPARHLRRRSHPSSPWELELAVQAVLDFDGEDPLDRAQGAHALAASS